MSKQALCVTTAALALPVGFEGIFTREQYAAALGEPGNPHLHPLNLKTTLQPRSTCESDLSYRQFISYVVVRSQSDKGTYFLTYQRGNKGGEAKLYDKYSIGFGGHVDTAPPEGKTLVSHLADEFARELREELNITVPYSQMLSMVKNCEYIYITEAPVDRPHLGLVVVLNVGDEMKAQTNEPDVICNLAWVAQADLLRFAKTNALENWSRIVIEKLTA